MGESIIIHNMHQICKDILERIKTQLSLDLFIFNLEYILDYEKIEHEITRNDSFICIIQGSFAIKMMTGDIISVEDIEKFQVFCKCKRIGLGSIYMFSNGVECNLRFAHINI